MPERSAMLYPPPSSLLASFLLLWVVLTGCPTRATPSDPASDPTSDLTSDPTSNPPSDPTADPTSLAPADLEPDLAPPDAPSWTDDWSLLPILFYQPETGLGFGTAVIRSLQLPRDNPSVSTIALGLLYTTNTQFITRLEPDLRFGRALFLHANLRFQRYPTRYFAPDSARGDPGEPYDERTLFGHLDLRTTLHGPFRAGLRWTYRLNHLTNFVADGALARRDDPGLHPFFASSLGPVLAYDTRDEPRRPTSGLLAELRLTLYHSIFGSDYLGLHGSLDIRAYLSLGAGHVLAAELAAQMTTGTLPFQLLPRLGGANELRGWYDGHLRDRHTVLAQVEWRFPLWQRLGGAVFLAAGEALHRLDAFRLSRVRLGAGLGLRYLLNEKQNVSVRLDFALGDAFSAYFDVLEAF